jgi:striatin 1/3/4
MSGLAGPGGYGNHNAGFGGMNNLQPSQMSNGGGMGGGGMGPGGPGGQQGGLGTPGNGTNGASGTNPETSSNGQTDYTLAGILHYLQSEWRRYERDRNEWEIERAEMRVSVMPSHVERGAIFPRICFAE